MGYPPTQHVGGQGDATHPVMGSCGPHSPAGRDAHNGRAQRLSFRATKLRIGLRPAV